MTRTMPKNNWFYEQNNSSARISRFLIHIFDLHCLPLVRITNDCLVSVNEVVTTPFDVKGTQTVV